jgi:dipeptidyl aminopeptidase/acylaminoacyl peptidase
VRKSGIGLVSGAAIVLLVALIGSLATDESQASAHPKPKPARNGLIAYSYAGDIYLGNPVTGKTVQITTNPRYEVNPVFSPRGKRIAFIRGNPQTGQSTIVVVRADGSDERVLLPRGRKHRGFGGIAWTPDGEWVLVQLDTPPFTYSHDDGELSLVDASGTGEERLLTPPLPLSIGGHYFNTSIPVAPMFRPPYGDRILSADENGLRIFNAELSRATRLGGDVLKRYKPYTLNWLTWSPDGTRIALYLALLPTTVPRDADGVFVMSAKGDKLRRVARDGSFLQWSPDGSLLAYERARSKVDRGVIVLADIKTGKKRSLESTLAPGKEAGARLGRDRTQVKRGKNIDVHGELCLPEPPVSEPRRCLESIRHPHFVVAHRLEHEVGNLVAVVAHELANATRKAFRTPARIAAYARRKALASHTARTR